LQEVLGKNRNILRFLMILYIWNITSLRMKIKKGRINSESIHLIPRPAGDEGAFYPRNGGYNLEEPYLSMRSLEKSDKCRKICQSSTEPYCENTCASKRRAR
jgi:hypothetical protein